jgi:hypothetical protein
MATGTRSVLQCNTQQIAVVLVQTDNEAALGRCMCEQQHYLLYVARVAFTQLHCAAALMLCCRVA